MPIRIDYESPTVRGALTLFPVFRDEPPIQDYVTGPEAAEKSLFNVSERGDGAVVPELVVTNRADLPLLLIEGEVLVGARQNRTLNVTVLCHPNGETVIPVSCVEAGRWGRVRKGGRSQWHADLSVREAKMRSVLASVRSGAGKRSDQGLVWDTIDLFATKHGVASATSALNEVQDAIAKKFESLTKDLGPAPAQWCGVAVGIAGKARALDVFDRPATLAVYWRSLLSGYAGEALDAENRPTPPAAMRALVDEVLTADATETAGAGLGTERHFGSQGVAGMELRVGDSGLHLSAFALRREPGAEQGEDDEAKLA